MIDSSDITVKIILVMSNLFLTTQDRDSLNLNEITKKSFTKMSQKI